MKNNSPYLPLHKFLKSIDNDLKQANNADILASLSYLKGLTTEQQDNRILYDTLTNREQEVLHLIADHKSSSSIAEELGISEDTVFTHRKNILKKIKKEYAGNLVLFANTFKKK